MIIKLSNGVEISEDTVVAALKKAGISVKPKHIFRAGDVVETNWLVNKKRIIVKTRGGLVSVDEGGIQRDGNTGGNNFDGCDYQHVGRLSDILN